MLEMCHQDFLFCIFYYLGFLSVFGAIGADIFIIWNSFKSKKNRKGND